MSEYSHIQWVPPTREEVLSRLHPNPTIIGGLKKSYNYPLFGEGTATYFGKVGIPLLIKPIISWKLGELKNVFEWECENYQEKYIYRNNIYISRDLRYKLEDIFTRALPEYNQIRNKVFNDNLLFFSES